MKIYIYSNEYETYEVFKLNNKWVVMQDGVMAEGRYDTLKKAKTAIDNQEIYF